MVGGIEMFLDTPNPLIPKKFRGGFNIFYRPPPHQSIFVYGVVVKIYFIDPNPIKTFFVCGGEGVVNVFFVDPNPHQTICVCGGGGYIFSSIKNQSLKVNFLHNCSSYKKKT